MPSHKDFSDQVSISLIEFPISAGITCHVIQSGVILAAGGNAFSLPNSVNYDLGPVAGSICDSLNTGIKENQIASSISINPNPAHEFYWINCGLNSNDQLLYALYSSTGQLIDRKNLYGSIRSLKADCSDFAKGIYFYKVIRKNLLVSEGKLVVE